MTDSAVRSGRWTTDRHSRLPGVPLGESAEHDGGLDSGAFAGRDELAPRLVGHADGPLRVACCWHGPNGTGWYPPRASARVVGWYPP